MNNQKYTKKINHRKFNTKVNFAELFLAEMSNKFYGMVVINSGDVKVDAPLTKETLSLRVIDYVMTFTEQIPILGKFLSDISQSISSYFFVKRPMYSAQYNLSFPSRSKFDVYAEIILLIFNGCFKENRFLDPKKLTKKFFKFTSSNAVEELWQDIDNYKLKDKLQNCVNNKEIEEYKAKFILFAAVFISELSGLAMGEVSQQVEKYVLANINKLKAIKTQEEKNAESALERERLKVQNVELKDNLDSTQNIVCRLLSTKIEGISFVECINELQQGIKHAVV